MKKPKVVPIADIEAIDLGSAGLGVPRRASPRSRTALHTLAVCSSGVVHFIQHVPENRSIPFLYASIHFFTHAINSEFVIGELKTQRMDDTLLPVN